MPELTMEDVKDALRSFNDRLENLEALFGELGSTCAEGFRATSASLRNLEGQVSEVRGEW